MTELKIEKIMKILELPLEMTLKQLGMELFVPPAINLHWMAGYLFIYREHRAMHPHKGWKRITFVQAVEDIQYYKTEYHSFVELNQETASIALTDVPEKKTESVLFPVMFFDDHLHRKIVEKIKEVEDGKSKGNIKI